MWYHARVISRQFYLIILAYYPLIEYYPASGVRTFTKVSTYCDCLMIRYAVIDVCVIVYSMPHLCSSFKTLMCDHYHLI